MSNEMTLSADVMFLQNKNAARITGWLGALFDGPAGSAGNVVLTLVHLAADGGQRVLRQFPFEGTPEAAACADVVRQIESVAMDDAGQLPGARQRYLLSASGDRGSEFGSIILPYTPLAASWSDSGVEEPNERGVVRQLIQHNQALHVLLIQTVTPLVDSTSRRIVQQDHLIERSFERQARFVDEKEELATKRLERDLALEAARNEQNVEMLKQVSAVQRDEDFRKFGLDKIGAILPVVVNRMAKGNVVPTHTTPVEQMVAALAQRLGPAEVAALKALLRPEVGALFDELISEGRSSAKDGSSGPPANTSPSPKAGAPSAPATPIPAAGPLDKIPPVAFHASIQILKQDLLVWAAEPGNAGKDPIEEKPYAVLLLARLMASMTVSNFETYIMKSQLLSEKDRQAFLALLERCDLGPGLAEEVKPT
jgi:hypothetical protein